MMRDLEQSVYAVEAARETGLPVWIGFSCKRSGDGTIVLWDGHDMLPEAVAELSPRGGSLISVMHTLVQDTVPALREVAKRWDGPIGAYPHSGKFIMPNWQFVDMISPGVFAEEARGWVEQGVRVVGGCCGIGPEHIRVLKERLPARVPYGE